MMKNTLLSIQFFLLAVLLLQTNQFGLFAQPEAWPLEKCLEWGLTNHPAITSADGNIQSAEAQKAQNDANLAPKLSLSATFNRQKQDFRRTTRGLSTDDLVDSTNQSLSYRQTISDWGRTKSKVKAGEESVNAARAARAWQLLQIAGNIKAAYFSVLQAQALVKVQKDTLARFEEHLTKVAGFVEVGSRPPYDVTKAQVDVANTRVSLIKAENTLRTAQANLVKAVGYDGEILVQPLANATPPTASETLPLEHLLSEALTRPDLIELRHQITAGRHRLHSTAKGLAPTFSAGAGYSMSGSVTPLDRDWNAQLSLSVPFLDGKLTHFQVKDVEGSLKSSEGRLQQLEQSVRAEVEIALANVNDAFQRLEATNVLLQQARESLELAEGRYEAGLGSPIEVTDARTAFSSAEGNHVTALFDGYIALAKLDQVRGRFPPETGSSPEIPPSDPSPLQDETPDSQAEAQIP